MEGCHSAPILPDARSNDFSIVPDDRRVGYSAGEADDLRKGVTYGGMPFFEVAVPQPQPPSAGWFSDIWTIPGSYYLTSWLSRSDSWPGKSYAAAEYGGTPYFEVAVPEPQPPSAGWFSYIWTIPGSYSLTSWLSRSSTTPRLEGRPSAGDSRADIRGPRTYNRGQYSEPKHRSYDGNYIESRGLNGAHLGQVDDTPRGIDDHQRFLARSEAHINVLKVSLTEKDNFIERLENRIKHVEKCLQDSESDYRAKTKSYYLEKMRADKLEKENREYQEKLRGLYSEKTRANALEREIREYEGKSEACLRSEKMRADNLERENREQQAKLQMKEREVGELLLKLQASGAATAALDVRDAELKMFQSTYQNIRRENQELKSWRIEYEKKLQNDVSTTGELNTKVSDLTTSNSQLEKQKGLLTTQAQEQVKRIQELKQQVSVLELKMGARDSESQSLRERLREERDKSSRLSDALRQNNVRSAYQNIRRSENQELESWRTEEYQENLQNDMSTAGEHLLQLPAAGAPAAAVEVRDVSNNYQNIRRENQELKSWRIEEYEEKLQNDMSTTGEHLLQLPAAGAPAAAVEVRDVSNNYQNIRRENQELKSWRIEEYEEKLQNDMSTTGEHLLQLPAAGAPAAAVDVRDVSNNYQNIRRENLELKSWRIIENETNSAE